jgi:isoleucyl-tRNA synthetase
LPEVAGVAVEPGLAEGCKCARCWRILPEVAPPKMLCLRCEDAVAAFDAAHGDTDVPA